MPPQTAFISRLLQRPVGSTVRQVGPSGPRSPIWLQRQQQTSVSRGAALEARFSSTARTSRWRPQFKQTNSPSTPHVRSFLRRLFSIKQQSPSPSLSERLKTLSREYGWSALGVYLALSALDFPFCFVAVRLLGVERIGHLEHVVMESVKDVFKAVWPIKGTPGDPTGTEKDTSGRGEASAHEDDHGVLEAEKQNLGEGASIWTQLALAYAIHKSFIFIRVPLTAAVTPKVVKTLRGWGWNIGKRISKGKQIN